MTETLTQAWAVAWIERWDAQQQYLLPDREERFTALIDAVQECAGRPDPHLSITARRPGGSKFMSTPSARPGSPKLAPSGSAGTTGSSAGSWGDAPNERPLV